MSSLNQIEMVLKKSTQELVSNEYVIEDNSDVPNDFLSLYPENAGYYNAFSKARISNFSFGCINVIKGAQRISSIPYFLTHFKLNTMLDDGFLKKILGWVSFKIVCVGHPSCDIGRIDGSVDSKVLSLVNEYIGKKASIIAYKGFNDSLNLKQFTKIRGLPVAVQKLSGNYWNSLGAKTRSNFKKKMENSQHLSCRIVNSLSADQAASVYSLYRETYEKAAVKFEELNLEYFLCSSPNYRYLLFYDRSEIVGFSQIIVSKPKLVLRYVGINYLKTKGTDLYFRFFLETIRFAEQNGFNDIDWGVTSYQFKKRLGSVLQETYNYYYHSNPIANWFLKKLAFLLEPSEQELK